MTRVLIVDDDRQLLAALRINLTARGYDVTTALDGTTGLAEARNHRPDVVIVDLGLPDMDGAAVVEGLRRWTAVPIVVLSARHSEPVKVTPSTPAPTTTSVTADAIAAMLHLSGRGGLDLPPGSPLADAVSSSDTPAVTACPGPGLTL